jgi:hypothetical protein
MEATFISHLQLASGLKAYWKPLLFLPVPALPSRLGFTTAAFRRLFSRQTSGQPDSHFPPTFSWHYHPAASQVPPRFSSTIHCESPQFSYWASCSISARRHRYWAVAKQMEHQAEGQLQAEHPSLLGSCGATKLGSSHPGPFSRPGSTTREPGSASHEHLTFFFPDTGRGASSTAGFGWRGGSGV